MKMNTLQRLVVLLVSLLILTACGGGGLNTTSETPAKKITGQFIDAPVN